MIWFNHILTKSRAFAISKNKQLTAFFQGLENFFSQIRTFFDLVYFDLFPFTTRELDEWDRQFNLPPDSTLTEDQRRARIDAAWRRVGGQSPSYIQKTLRDAGFNVYIHEWWEPNTNPPVARNPNEYIRNDLIPPQCGEALAQCGEPSAQCTGVGFSPIVTYNVEAGEAGAEAGNIEAEAGNFSNNTSGTGYLLVNKLTRTIHRAQMSCGDQLAQCGEPVAQCGVVYRFVKRVYEIPDDPTKWPYFLYFGGVVFGSPAVIEESRKDEFENLLLQICPAQQWLALTVTFI